MCPRSPKLYSKQSMIKPRHHKQGTKPPPYTIQLTNQPARYRPAPIGLNIPCRYKHNNNYILHHKRRLQRQFGTTHPSTISAQSSICNISQCVKGSPYMLTINKIENDCSDDIVKKLINEMIISAYEDPKYFTVMFGKYVLVNNKGNRNAGEMATAIARRIRGERA